MRLIKEPSTGESMTLKNCTTVRYCICWLDQFVPTYWDFATKKPMTRQRILFLSRKLKQHWKQFEQMLIQIHKLKEGETWSAEDACYWSLVETSFKPNIQEKRTPIFIPLREFKP